jgi:hypothetical protein
MYQSWLINTSLPGCVDGAGFDKTYGVGTNHLYEMCRK